MFEKMSDYDTALKIIVIGSEGVGKSSLILRYARDHYVDFHISNLGADYLEKTINVFDKTVKTKVWDSNAEQFYRKADKLIPSAQVIMHVVDLSQNDDQIVQDIKGWHMFLDRHQPRTRVVVGTKSDISGEPITELNHRLHSLLQKAGVSNIIYGAVSSKTGEGVEFIFTQAAEVVLRKIQNVMSSKQNKSSNTSLPITKDIKDMSKEELQKEVERLRKGKNTNNNDDEEIKISNPFLISNKVETELDDFRVDIVMKLQTHISKLATELNKFNPNTKEYNKLNNKIIGFYNIKRQILNDTKTDLLTIIKWGRKAAPEIESGFFNAETKFLNSLEKEIEQHNTASVEKQYVKEIK